jgi:ABC-type antimicrobial peptide transport system permease subunit
MLDNQPHRLNFFRGISSTFKLAKGRWRQHWLLLLFITLGMMASITLVCTIPLLSEVLQTASLRDTLSASPENGELSAHITSTGLSNQTVQDFFPTIDHAFQKYLKSNLTSPPQLEVLTPNFTFLSPALPFNNQMTIDATSMALSANHVTLTQGRLPLASSSDIEIAITPEAANLLGVKLNDFITLQLNYVARSAPPPFGTLVPTHQALRLHVVGLFHVQTDDPFWHGESFLPQLPQSDAVPITLFTALTSDRSFLAALDQIAATHYEPQSQVIFTSVSFLTWHYHLNPASVSINQLDDLINRLAAVQVAITNTFNFAGESLVISGLPFHSPSQSSLLEQFRTRLSTARIPVAIFTALILGLLLFFISVMILLLLDRQAEAIFVLRSRGASNIQLFLSLLTQCAGLSIIALIAGLLLTPPALLLSARLLLSAADQSALDVVTNALAQSLWSIRYYALITALATVVVMSLALLGISRLSLMTTGSESKHTARYPLWRRLNLDLFAILIALVGYGLSLYFTSIQQQLDAQTQLLVAGPVAFIGPFFLLVAAILLALRVFPWLLQLGATLAGRGHGTIPLLALAQISRAPRKSLRMILLLALTIAFAIFSLVFAASEGQRANEIASYEVGADFSGAIPINSYAYAPQQEAALYRHIPGVTSASAGFEEEGSLTSVPPFLSLLLRAVDPSTYANTASWTPQDSGQPLSSLMAQLLAQRDAAITHDFVPAIIDTALSNELPLRVGSTFTVLPDVTHQFNILVGHIHYVVIARVDHIPGVNESVEGGMLVDYQTFAKVLSKVAGTNGVNIISNHIWLRTTEAAASAIHTTLTSSNLRLAFLSDRYALVNALLDDPSYENLIGVLAFGVSAAFLLALFANLLASWISARNRLTSFVVLRALGASTRGIASVFLWEQGIVYTAALLLGILFGALLVFTLVPALVFTGIPPGAGVVNGNSIDFAALQHIIPVQVAAPFSLVIAMLVFIAICAIALGMMVSLVLQRSIGQELRLNDDARLDFATREVVSTPRARAKAVQTNGQHLLTHSSLAQLTLLQFRRARLLTMLAGVTIIAAVGIMCLLPLYSSITINGGLHTLLRATPATSQIMLDTSTQALSTRTLNGVEHSMGSLVQRDVGAYLDQTHSYTIQEADFQLVHSSAGSQVGSVSLVSAPFNQAASHLTLLQGRMPGNTGGDIEALLTPDTARNLNTAVGSRLTLSLSTFAARPPNPPIHQTITLNVLVVGLIKVVPGDPYWHGNDFQPAASGSQTFSDTLLVPNAAFLAVFDQAASELQTDAIFTSQPFEITWDYQLNITPLVVDQLDTLIGSLQRLQSDITHTSETVQNSIPLDGITNFPYLTQVAIFNSAKNTFDLPDTLSRYRSRVAVIAIPIFILSALIIGLLLFFVSLVAYLQVDRQAAAIAILRSRGATNSQIFRSMVLLSVILGLIALVIGPILALVSASFLGGQSLASAGKDALTFFTNQPWNALLSVSWYALGTAFAAIIALIFALRYAAGMNIQGLRRESSRVTHRPLWQRLRLDVAAIVIAFAGYIISLYLSSTENLSDTRSVVLFASPLALIAPLFLVIGCILLLLRIYPSLLGLGARLANRGQGAISMLAFAHMSRAPRQTIRITLLLALTVAFAIFSLVFTASQAQRSSDIAAFESGADFSGSIAIPANQSQASLSGVTSPYRQLPGVISASAGFSEDGLLTQSTANIHIAVRAVDANTFAQAANWTTQDSSQSLTSLMALLRQQQAQGIRQDRVPAIIDASAASNQNLQVGSTFAIDMTGLPSYVSGSSDSILKCVVVALVQHIPTVNEGATLDANGDTSAINGGILLDYTTYAILYQRDNSLKAVASSAMSVTPQTALLPINYLWLHSQDEPATLTHLRAALTTSSLHLDHLYDRRALQDTLNSEPLYLDLLTLLTIGATITLLLVLIGYVLASWQNAKLRSGSFTTLRSLGATAAQVTSLFLLEQGVVFFTALIVGLLFGAILATTVVPTLVYSDIPITGILSNLSDSQFYLIQHSFSKQIVIPPSLSIALALLVGICLIAVGTMARTVLRPSLGQAIRLNED